MKKPLLISALILIAVANIAAQKNANADRERKAVLKESAEVKKEQQNPVIKCFLWRMSARCA